MGNWHDIVSRTANQAQIDAAMLKSMAASFRGNLPFSFSSDDMADLLDRLRADHIDHLL